MIEMKFPKINWTFVIAGFCIASGVLLPIGIIIILMWFWNDAKKFIKPEWTYTKNMFSTETEEGSK